MKGCHKRRLRFAATVSALAAGAVLGATPAPETPLSAQSGSIALEVELLDSLRPKRVSLEMDGRGRPTLLSSDGAAVFSVVLHRRDLSSTLASQLTVSARLVVTWEQGPESVYLALGPASPAQVWLPIAGPERPSVFNRAELERIDKLDTSFEGLLEKYMLARRFHRYWRHNNRSPAHELAIRSARIWFDAQRALMQREPLIFGEDDDLSETLDMYRGLAAADERVRARFQRQFPNKLLATAARQQASAAFSAVASVPRLIESGQLDAATQINTAALDAIASASSEVRRSVQSEQGVTEQLLKNNAAYLVTLSKSQAQVASPNGEDAVL